MQQWQGDWREAFWVEAGNSESQPWDMIVIGGGITGAGILREAVRYGLRVVLLEQNDFGSGTSSRSSKLVHGGLRYLAEGQWRLTLESVRERQRLLNEAPGLVDTLGFISPGYEGQKTPLWMMRIGLFVYDLMAGRLQTRGMTVSEVNQRVPRLNQQGLQGALYYSDAQTDDCRLVMRVITQALTDSADSLAVNYARVTDMLQSNQQITGVQVEDRLTGKHYSLRARQVVNASGAWADDVRALAGTAPRLRPLRGSHLVFPFYRLPVTEAVTLFHPVDNRPLFAVPWEGAVIFGTTDLDHDQSLSDQPVITAQETEYLLGGINRLFPDIQLGLQDVIATYAGVRPVVAGGRADAAPGEESREHVIWQEKGMITLAGGKLTTFRPIAREVLGLARETLCEIPEEQPDRRVLDAVDLSAVNTAKLSGAQVQRLVGRFGNRLNMLLAETPQALLRPIAGTPYLWAELVWVCDQEAVMTLEDLMLRRLRLGLVTAEGGKALLPRVREVCHDTLGWDDERWDSEMKNYLNCWQQQHAPDAGYASDAANRVAA